MKIRSKTILIISVLVLLFLIIVDFNFVTSSNYFNNVTMDYSENWKKEYDKELSGLLVNRQYFIQDVHTSEKTKTIVVNDSSRTEVIKAVNSKRHIEIKYIIKDLDISATRFIPLYKPIDYAANIIFKWKADVKFDYKSILVTNKGKMIIDGGADIKGWCSAREAKKMVNKQILEEVKRQIQKDIDKKIELIN